MFLGKEGKLKTGIPPYNRGGVPYLALTLFVFGILADDADDSLTKNDGAFIANLFDGRTDFHGGLGYFFLNTILPLERS